MLNNFDIVIYMKDIISDSSWSSSNRGRSAHPGRVGRCERGRHRAVRDQPGSSILCSRLVFEIYVLNLLLIGKKQSLVRETNKWYYIYRSYVRRSDS